MCMSEFMYSCPSCCCDVFFFSIAQLYALVSMDDSLDVSVCAYLRLCLCVKAS